MSGLHGYITRVVWLIVWLYSSHDSVSANSKKLIEDELAKHGVALNEQVSLGWKGGSVWLVPTVGDVVDWHPVARKSLN